MSGSASERHLLATKNGQLICFAPGDQNDAQACFAKQAHADADGSPVAIGRPQPGASGVVHSYEEVLSTLELADLLGLEAPVVRAAELIRTRDRQAIAEADGQAEAVGFLEHPAHGAFGVAAGEVVSSGGPLRGG